MNLLAHKGGLSSLIHKKGGPCIAQETSFVESGCLLNSQELKLPACGAFCLNEREGFPTSVLRIALCKIFQQMRIIGAPFANIAPQEARKC